MAIDTAGFAFPKPGAKEGRQVKTKAEMQAERRLRWARGERECSYCGRPIIDFGNYVLDHIMPASGFRLKDDSNGNLAPIHMFPCNGEKGSRRK